MCFTIFKNHNKHNSIGETGKTKHQTPTLFKQASFPTASPNHQFQWLEAKSEGHNPAASADAGEKDAEASGGEGTQGRRQEGAWNSGAALRVTGSPSTWWQSQSARRPRAHPHLPWGRHVHSHPVSGGSGAEGSRHCMAPKPRDLLTSS